MYAWLCVLHLEYECLGSAGARVSWYSPVLQGIDYDLNKHD
jgi:hypothetical protein